VAYRNSSRLFLVTALILTALFSPSFLGIRSANAFGNVDSPAPFFVDSQRNEHQNNGTSISSYLVLLDSKPRSEDVAIVESHHGRVSRIYNLVDGMAILLPDKMVNALLENNPRIKSIEPDVAVFATDINLDKQIRADQVWTGITYSSNGTGIPIAVLDTGIDITHPEFAGRIALCRSEILNTEGACNDENGHGTHVAGIASAKGLNNLAKGVAPDSMLYINQVLDSSGRGPMSGIIAGIDWSVANGAKIVSMSLSTSWTTSESANCDSNFPTLAAAIDRAVAAGVTVVSAAGNSGSTGVGAPGCISSSIAVGAVDSSDTIASFSGRGSAMADHGIVAPGVMIYSSYKGGTYATASGTSMATPGVAGAVALMLGVDQTLTPQQIKSSLFQNSCEHSTSPSCPAITITPSSTYGSGRIDTYASTATIVPVPADSKPDFSLTSSNPSLTIPKGKSGSITITIDSLNSFASDNIALSASSSPSISGIKYSFSKSSLQILESGEDYSALTISLPRNASPGSYALTITAIDKDGSGNNGIKLSHSIQITLNVTKR
jgi:subtilisin family serine protease